MIDKRRAVKNGRRISERTLAFFTLICGGIGALLGMCLLRHKTKKMKFRVLTALGLIVALIAVIYVVHCHTLDSIYSRLVAG